MKWFVKMLVNEKHIINQEMHSSWCKVEAHILAKAIEGFLRKKPMPEESRIRVRAKY